MTTGMTEHRPYEHSMIDIGMEMVGLAVYINMAQSLQVIGQMIDRDETLDIDEMLKVVETIASALAWMDSTGLAERHPELGDMPSKVDPLDFQGGGRHIIAWAEKEISNLKDKEKFKADSYLN
jgi:hypothetical protein